MLVPVRFGDFENLPELRLLGIFSKLGNALGTVFFHEVVLIKIKVVLSHLFELLLTHDKLGVVHLIPVDCLCVDLLLIGLLFDSLPVAHLDLDVFPLGRHSACHDAK